MGSNRSSSLSRIIFRQLWQKPAIVFLSRLARVHEKKMSLALVGLQSRFGLKLHVTWVVRPQNGTAVLR